jgi:restriction system protein
VARRRGFFAELNHQAQLAERGRQQQARAAYRAHEAARREAERAYRAAERASAAAGRANAAEQKAAEKEAARLHLESRHAEVAAMNADLAGVYAEIDGLLAATLDVDDWVDLERLRVTSVEHPAFDPGKLAHAASPPSLQYPPQPVWQEPEAPRGLSGVMGGRKRHEANVARARADYEQAYRAWHEQATAMHAAYQAQQARHAVDEEKRLAALAAARARYDEECKQRESDAAERNAELDRLINELSFDVEGAIQEYVGIVLSNSVYPESFPVAHDHRFDLATRELALVVRVPHPSQIPTVKEYRYVKAKDEIVPAVLPVKEQKERYASAVAQVAARSLHEVFEADRAGRIHSIALTVSTDHTDPATGLPVTGGCPESRGTSAAAR